MDKKIKIIIKKEDLRWKPRMGVQVGKIFKDKTKFTRKDKHKKNPLKKED